MPAPTQTIALIAVGNLGKYVCEALLADNRVDLVVISRKKHQWFEDRNIVVHQSDYGEDSVLSVLDSTVSSTLISFYNAENQEYVDVHQGWLNACLRSRNCKRFIPSEWAGNIDDFPHLPRFYGATREPFRQILKQTSGIEWTVFNCGWLMDYFLPQRLTRMPHEPGVFPIDPEKWRACIRGTGDEPQSWTWTKDMAKAVVELVLAPTWEPTTYVAGEWSTFNQAMKEMARFYDREFQVEHKPAGETVDEMDEWMLAGASACPKDKTLRQRETFFSAVEFSSLRDLLEWGAKG